MYKNKIVKPIVETSHVSSRLTLNSVRIDF